MQVHVFEFRWNSTEECIIQASLNNQWGQRKIHLNDSISLEITSDISCAGYNKDGQWNPCAEKNKGKAKCDLCRAKEGSFIYTSFDGFNRDGFSDQELQQISGNHLVYLALFDKELIKVGVSGKSRKELRQLEQGSHHTLFIAETPDGTAARQIETLFRKSGLLDKIKPSQKKDFLCPEITKAEGEQVLNKLFQKHKNALKDYPHLEGFLLNPPEFFSWKKQYGLNNIIQNSKPLQFVSLSEGESISGKIITIKGPFIVLETEQELFSISMKNFFGRMVDFTEKPGGLKLKEAFQSALF